MTKDSPIKTRSENIVKGVVVSDLHLLTNRSTAHHYLESFHQRANEHDVFVLNGDIFDFQWSTHGGFQHSIEVAKEWLTELISPHPDTAFIVLLGNHDSISEYRKLLTTLSDRHPNLMWKEDFICLGSSLFLHGDAFHAQSSHDLKAYRRHFNQQLRKHPIKHYAYSLAAKAGILRLCAISVSKKRCARHLLKYLSHEAPKKLASVTDIYFGHVHAPFFDFDFRGYRFHNTGAALPFLHCHTLSFECQTSDIPSQLKSK